MTLSDLLLGLGEEEAKDVRFAMTWELPPTPSVKKMMRLSELLARKMGDNFIGPKHLALALLTSDLGDTELLLKAIGVDLDVISEKAKALLPK